MRLCDAGLDRLDALHEEDELVVAAAAERLTFAGAATLEALCDGAKQGVALEVAERVVDVLEEIEVDVEQRGRPMLAACVDEACSNRPVRNARLGKPVRAS